MPTVAKWKPLVGNPSNRKSMARFVDPYARPEVRFRCSHDLSLVLEALKLGRYCHLTIIMYTPPSWPCWQCRIYHPSTSPNSAPFLETYRPVGIAMGNDPFGSMINVMIYRLKMLIFPALHPEHRRRLAAQVPLRPEACPAPERVMMGGWWS